MREGTLTFSPANKKRSITFTPSHLHSSPRTHHLSTMGRTLYVPNVQCKHTPWEGHYTLQRPDETRHVNQLWKGLETSERPAMSHDCHLIRVAEEHVIILMDGLVTMSTYSNYNQQLRTNTSNTASPDAYNILPTEGHKMSEHTLCARNSGSAKSLNHMGVRKERKPTHTTNYAPEQGANKSLFRIKCLYTSAQEHDFRSHFFLVRLLDPGLLPEYCTS